jgi:hypothetical protein
MMDILWDYLNGRAARSTGYTTRGSRVGFGNMPIITKKDSVSHIFT